MENNIAKLLKLAEQNKDKLNYKKAFIKSLSEEDIYLYKNQLTYTSNKMSGNELSEKQVKKILDNGEFIQGINVKDFYETLGHAEAFDYMIKASKKTNLIITENMLKQIHSRLYKEIIGKKAGKYRDLQIYQSELKYMPPVADDVPRLMEHFINQMEMSCNTLSTIEYAVMCHNRILEIQPFLEGNELIARLILNLILVNKGYGFVIIDSELREKYLQAVIDARATDTPMFDDVVELVLGCLVKTQDELLKEKDI